MKMLSKIAFVSVLAFAGCATSIHSPGRRNFDQGVQALERRDYPVAYRFLEQPSAGTESAVLALMQSNPRLVEAGRLTFTPAELAESIGRYGRAQAFKIEHSRLERFAVYSEAGAFREAADSIAAAFPKELAEHHEHEAERARVAKLPDAEQRKYWAEAFKRSVEAETVRGTIVSAQLVDLSSPGTTLGANLGSVVAQAAYIDSASWRSYRATTQLGAGILGGLLGSVLDERPRTVFQKAYLIKTRSGDVRRIEERTSDPVLLPVGVCIEYREPFQLTIAAQDLCSR